MQKMKLHDLAAHLGATLHGDGDTEITGVAGIEEAVSGHITFVSNPRYAGAAKTTRASAVLVAPEFSGDRRRHSAARESLPRFRPGHRAFASGAGIYAGYAQRP